MKSSKVENDLPWSKYKHKAWRLLSGDNLEVPTAPDINNFKACISYFAPLLEVLVFGMDKDPLEGIEEFLVEYESGEISSWQVKWWGPALIDIHAWLCSSKPYLNGSTRKHNKYVANLSVRSGPYAQLFQGGTDPMHLASHSRDRREDYLLQEPKKIPSSNANSSNADFVFMKYLKTNFNKKVGSLSEDDIVDLVLKFGVWMSLDSYKKTPWIARYALRTVRDRTDERVAGEKRDLWGLPSTEGYFTDDNSLIKDSYKNMKIIGKNNPYSGQAISSGFVCCHVWSSTTKNPLLFSFIPNLIWLPKSLASFTDVLGNKPVHKVHYVLQNVSIQRFRSIEVNTGVADVAKAWNTLTGNNSNLPKNFDCAEFLSEPKLSNRVKKRHERLESFLNSALAGPPYNEKRFSARYHLGVGSGIDNSVSKFTDIVKQEQIYKLLNVVTQTMPTSFNDKKADRGRSRV
jgi:hypothetical protein